MRRVFQISARMEREILTVALPPHGNVRVKRRGAGGGGTDFREMTPAERLENLRERLRRIAPVGIALAYSGGMN